MTPESHAAAPFAAHCELLRLLLAQREDVVGRLQDLLNARRRPVEFLQDRWQLARLIHDCFFTLPAISDDQARLGGQLEAAHRASGFQPRAVHELFNDLFDPAEMTVRGFFCWQQTRWPGRNGRIRYAHTLFDLFVLRQLVFLSMRVWDDAAGNAGARLAQVQVLLDALWQGAPADQPVLVRDARWLIPLAQSPTTDELGAYFDVAKNVAESLPVADRLAVQKSHVRVLGGHLTSQIRHYCLKDGVTIDDESVVRRTRTSNGLDFALLVQALVSLLEAYETAIDAGNDEARHELAGAICQGISPDPELFVNQVDLLGPYSMIDYLFIETDAAGKAGYSAPGRRHARLYQDYAGLIGRLSGQLAADHARFAPIVGRYSAYGAIFGSPSNLVEDMALKTLQHDGVTNFSLEDVLADGDGAKLAWVNGWRKLPHVPLEIQQQYEYPQAFAAAIFERIESALQRSRSRQPGSESRRTGCLVLSADAPAPDLPAGLIVSSDREFVAAGSGVACEPSRLLRDRQEGYFLVSYATAGGWVAVRKDLLTEVLGAGHDARLAVLPPAAAATLRLMCPRIEIR